MCECVHVYVGVAYTSGVYCLRRGTDGHLNPAVTLALAVIRRLSIARCVAFIAAQFTGQCVSDFTLMGCLHDPANVQQTSSKCSQNTRANAGRLLDRVNTLLAY